MRGNVLVAAMVAAGFCGVLMLEANVATASVEHVIALQPAASQPGGNWAIPDNDPLGKSFTFVVDAADAGPIEKVELVFSAQHTYDPDLTASLFSPYGTEVLLFSELWRDGQNFTGTRFSDAAGVAITDGIPPYEHTYRVEDPAGLAAFVGDPSAYNGTPWRLHITDPYEWDTGAVVPEGTALHIWIVPEPATLIVVLLGAGLAGRRRRRRG